MELMFIIMWENGTRHIQLLLDGTRLSRLFVFVVVIKKKQKKQLLVLKKQVFI